MKPKGERGITHSGRASVLFSYPRCFPPYSPALASPSQTYPNNLFFSVSCKAFLSFSP